MNYLLGIQIGDIEDIIRPNCGSLMLRTPYHGKITLQTYINRCFIGLYKSYRAQ